MARGGRKRKPATRRQPSGRIAYGAANAKGDRAQDMVSVVKEARQRVLGMTVEQSGLDMETGVMARLCATGEISRRQYDALALYRDIVLEHQRMVLARPVPSPNDYGRSGGYDDSDGDDPLYVLAYNRALDRRDRCVAALRSCADSFALSVVNAIAVSGLDAPHFVGSLRIGANAIVREMGVPEPPLPKAIDKTRQLEDAQ